MSKFHVARSINIAAPIEQVRTLLTDFTQWPYWSPWLIAEPDATINYNNKQGEVGAKYDWEGKIVGSGSMEILNINDQQIEIQLAFITPFKSIAQVVFDLESQGDETKITWNMFGKLPFFLFFMAEKMKRYIGMDYERGLNMLKDYIETGTVSSTLNIQGIIEQQGQQYIGIKNNCAIKDIGSVMPTDFKKLGDFFAENKLSIDGNPFAIYTEFNLKNQHTHFISVIPTNMDIDVNPPFIKGSTKTEQAIKVVHTGKYTYLNNAWAAAIMYSRAKKIKTKKSPVGMEFYLNDPQTTDPAELITEVLLPLN